MTHIIKFVYSNTCLCLFLYANDVMVVETRGKVANLTVANLETKLSAREGRNGRKQWKIVPKILHRSMLVDLFVL